MIDLILERFAEIPEQGTFGRFYHRGNYLGYSVEKEYKNNTPFTSCVPTGRYELIPFSSKKYGEVLSLSNSENNIYVKKEDTVYVTDRYGILIHSANWANQLQGCIAPGKDLSFSNNSFMVTNSKNTLSSLLSYIEENNITHLTIVGKDLSYGTN